jgi:small subunit ribosomal protein S9
MKVIHTSGKRKSSVARASLYPGTGIIRINGFKLDNWNPGMNQLKVREPMILAGDIAEKADIRINVHGGGVSSQAEASRLALARALVEFDKKLEKTFLEYDRQLLVADVRQRESRKPNTHGKARSKRQKSYR